jgi:hypothetical protein
MKRVFWIALITFGSTAALQAQKIQIPESWDRLAAKADEVDNVTLDKSMLGLASKFMKDDDDKDSGEVNRLLSKLKAIYVRHLEFKTPGQYTYSDVEPVRAQLNTAQWTQIVDVKDKTSKENVSVYVKEVNHEKVGIVVLAEEPTELTFVQLDGPIDTDDLDKLGGNFGVPKLQLRGNNKGTPAPPSSDAKTPSAPDVKK